MSDMATINRYPSSLNLQYNATNRKQLTSYPLVRTTPKKNVCQNKLQKARRQFLVTLSSWLHWLTDLCFYTEE